MHRRPLWVIVAVLVIVANGVTSVAGYIDRHRTAAEELRRHNEVMGLLEKIAEQRDGTR